MRAELSLKGRDRKSRGAGRGGAKEVGQKKKGTHPEGSEIGV